MCLCPHTDTYYTSHRLFYSLLSSRSVCLCSVPVAVVWHGPVFFQCSHSTCDISVLRTGCNAQIWFLNKIKWSFRFLFRPSFRKATWDRRKKFQRGEKGFSEITLTTGPACILSSPERARLIKNSLQINLRGDLLGFLAQNTTTHASSAAAGRCFSRASRSHTPDNTIPSFPRSMSSHNA